MSDLNKMKAKMQALSGKKARVTAVKSADTSLRTVQGKQDRSKAARKSKNKGSTYERKIAKKFGAWSGETLRRTPQSGGWHGADAHGVSGDLVCDRRKFPFHIECKKREGWTLEDLIVGVRQATTDSRSVLGWWAQTRRTCPPGKLAVLIFARNRIPDLIMMRRTDFYALVGGDFTTEFLPHYTFALDAGEVVILSLDDFFVKVRPPKGCRGRKTWTTGPGALLAAAHINDNDDGQED